jgi:hypothetical protein
LMNLFSWQPFFNLAQAQKVAKTAFSSSYASYDTPELSNQLDKNRQQMSAYPCKMWAFLFFFSILYSFMFLLCRCGTRINRPMTNSSCSNLLKHAAGCLKKKTEKYQTLSLVSLGVSRTGEVDFRSTNQVFFSAYWPFIKQVNQQCAIWCAEAAQPFSALEYESLKRLLHPTVLKHLPNRCMVSKSIHILYTAVQESLKLELQVGSTPFSCLCNIF